MRFVVTTRQRQPGRLGALPPAPDPALVPAEAEWLVGGEPTLRTDLPALVGRCHPVGIETDGLALSTEEALAPLISAGLVAVRIHLHSARSDAHDWLVGQPGAARRARRALSACRAAGLRVEAIVALTRPTLGHLAETTALVRHLGASEVHLRLPLLQPEDRDYFAVMPQQPFIDEAVAASGRWASVNTSARWPS